MAKYIGEVEITVWYTLSDVEVEADSEVEAQSKMQKLGEEVEQDTIMKDGMWDYDADCELAEDEEDETE